jgi:hypothetical protein
MFSKEWTDLPGDPDIADQYIVDVPPMREEYERLLARRHQGRFASPIDRAAIARLIREREESLWP